MAALARVPPERLLASDGALGTWPVTSRKLSAGRLTALPLLTAKDLGITAHLTASRLEFKLALMGQRPG